MASRADSIANAWSRDQGCSAVSVTITPIGKERHRLSRFWGRWGSSSAGA